MQLGADNMMVFQPSPSGIYEHLRELFSVPVSICVATPEMFDMPLDVQELNFIKGAREKRFREFSAGRAAAHRALKEIGAPDLPILVNADRSPCWPSGFSGSISHCEGFCIAAACNSKAARSIGIDVEHTTRLPEASVSLVCDAEEVRNFAKLPFLLNASWEKIAFCAKEAFYKCYYPITERYLDFLDVSVRFTAEHNLVTRYNLEMGVFKCVVKRGENAPCNVILGRWLVSQSFIFAAATCTN